MAEVTRIGFKLLLALAVVAAGFVVTEVAFHFGISLPAFVLFYPAVILIAILFGMAPGLFATLLSAVAVFCWIVPQKLKLPSGRADYEVALIVFVLMGACLSFFADRYRRNVRRTTSLEKQLAMQEVQQALQFALQAAHAGTWKWDLRTNERFWSEEFWQLCGLEPDSLKPSYDSLFQIMHPEDRERAASAARTARETGKELNVEFRIIHSDGSVRWLLSQGKPVLDDRGAAIAYLGIVLDVTGRKCAELALRDSERRLRLFVEHAPAALAMFDLEMRYLFASRRWLSDYGLSDEIIGKSHYEAIPEIPGRWKELHRRAMQGEVLRDERDCLVRRGGGVQWLRWEIRPWHDDEGKIGGIVIFSEDISERIHADEELQRHRARLEEMGRMAQVGAWEFDASTGEGLWTSEIASIHDIDVLSPVNMADGVGFFHGEFRERIKAAIHDVIALARPYDLELELISAKGVRKWVRTIGYPVLQDGKVVRVHGIMQDITGLRKTELELLESQRRLQVALSAAHLGVWTRDLSTGEGFWDDAARKMGGFGPDASVGYEEFISRVVPEDRDAMRKMIDVWMEKENQGIEFRIMRPDGEIRWLNALGSALFDANGACTRISGVLMDITDHKQSEKERKSLEEQLRHAQKMEAVGRLAGGVAHDFNNLLMVIRSYAEMMHEALPPGDNMRRKTQQILQSSDRAASLTAQLLAFSRKQIASPALLDLSVVVRDALKMLQRLVGEDVTVRFQAGGNLWAVQADPDQLVQVLMNLCVNSRDAMPQGGQLTISTRNVSVTEPMPAMEHIPPGNYVELSVADTGIGIGADTVQHLFEPFFTTKGIGRGSGLGLSIVYGIVEQSGGHIGVVSEQGKGACFSIYLPKAADAATPAVFGREYLFEKGSGVLLVAEDEAPLRDSIVEYLRSLGYTVLSADSGQQALAIAADHGGKIDLLLTDVVMPNMSGRELSETLHAHSPAMKTVYMSGYTEDAVVRYGAKGAGVAFLQKPFSMATLARRVREALPKNDREASTSADG